MVSSDKSDGSAKRRHRSLKHFPKWSRGLSDGERQIRYGAAGEGTCELGVEGQGVKMVMWPNFVTFMTFVETSFNQCQRLQFMPIRIALFHFGLLKR